MNGPLIDLCSDSSIGEDDVKAEQLSAFYETTTGSRRQSEGSNADDPIILDHDPSQDNDTVKPPPKKLGTTADDPISFSDDDDLEEARTAFIMPKWTPRHQPNPIKEEETIFMVEKSSSEKGHPDIIYIDDDEYDDGIQAQQHGRLSRIACRREQGSPAFNQITTIDITSDTEDSSIIDSSDDEAEYRRFLTVRRKQTQQSQVERIQLDDDSDSDSSDDESSHDFLPPASLSIGGRQNTDLSNSQLPSTAKLKSPPKSADQGCHSESTSSTFSLQSNQSTKPLTQPSEMENHHTDLRSIHIAALANNEKLDVQGFGGLPKRGKSDEDGGLFGGDSSFSVKSTILPTKSPGKVLTRIPSFSESDDSSIDRDDFSLDTAAEDEGFVGGRDAPIKKKEKMQHPSDMGVMPKINHLCSLENNAETGLPIYRFSVHGHDAEIIYDFEINVKTSNIPNAGRGVFLTFVGARELKPSRKQWGEDLRKERPARYLKTLSEPATAIHSDGFGIALTITGEHLHGPYNCQNPLRTLKAHLPNKLRNPEVTVRFSNFEDPYCEEEIAGLRKDPGRIGPLGLFTESDYVHAPRRTFSSRHINCGVIELGKYGPFQPRDRKMEANFNVKSFIFGNVPNEWGFDVPEKINGKPQMIDVTDDMTGEPHDLACKHIPMYVNEVGHNKKLKQTVWALDNYGRSVHYYFAINKPMKAGETIELLVAYAGHYELVRQRKGYGLSNLRGTEKSDACFATLLKRNFAERDAIEEDIAELNAMEFYMMMEWLVSLSSKLLEKMDKFMLEVSTSGSAVAPEHCPSGLQLIAVRRLTWLSVLFEKKLDALRSDPHPDLAGFGGVFDQCSLSIAAIKWPSWRDFFNVLEKHPEINDSRGKSIKKVFESEIVEEVLFGMKEMISSPLDESLWCNVAVRLTKSLCNATVKALCSEQQGSQNWLFETFMKLGLQASKEIRVPSSPQDLAFYPKFRGKFPGVDDDDDLAELGQKGFSPSVEAGSQGEVLTRFKQESESDPLAIQPQALQENVRKELMVIPCSVVANKENIDRQSESTVQLEIQETWYLCWQVLYVVHAFSRTFLKESPYSLDNLCSTLSVDSNDVASSIMKRIEKATEAQSKSKKRKWSVTSPDKPHKKAKKLKKKSRGRTKGSKKYKSLFWSIVWPCLRDKCGWHVEYGNRPSDFYACPPGVCRGRGLGFKPRVDYFDSVPLVLRCITTDTKWVNVPEIKEALEEYTKHLKK